MKRCTAMASSPHLLLMRCQGTQVQHGQSPTWHRSSGCAAEERPLLHPGFVVAFHALFGCDSPLTGAAAPRLAALQVLLMHSSAMVKPLLGAADALHCLHKPLPCCRPSQLLLTQNTQGCLPPQAFRHCPPLVPSQVLLVLWGGVGTELSPLGHRVHLGRCLNCPCWSAGLPGRAGKHIDTI